jgi:hypothetical protein
MTLEIDIGMSKVAFRVHVQSVECSNVAEVGIGIIITVAFESCMY